MATFPALIPTTRTRTPGSYPLTPHTAANGREVRIRHSSRGTGDRLQLGFINCTESAVHAIRDHWLGQGTRLSFALSSEVQTGLAASITPTGCSWRYAKPPQVEDIKEDIHSVSLELELVPLPPA